MKTVKTLQGFNDALFESNQLMLSGGGGRFEIFSDYETESGKREGTIHRLELFPKGYRLQTVKRSDWNEKKKRFDTLLDGPEIRVENRRGIKKTLGFIESIRQLFIYDYRQFTDPRGMTIVYFGHDVKRELMNTHLKYA